MSKSYAGARLRRLREERRMSQAELARVLAISPSYLNQMEHDSRPLTVPVLLRLTEAFGVDAGFFSERDTSRLMADLREAMADEVAAARVSASDLSELASRLPGVAEALLRLSRRNQELGERLAEAADGRAVSAESSTPRTPHEEIREFFYRRQNYLHDADTAAEELAATVGIRPGEVRQALAARLAHQHRVRVTSDGDRPHQFNPRDRTLHLSPRLSPGQQAFRMATQLALLEYGDEISGHASEDFDEGTSTWKLARIGVANYFAAALILPYRGFHAAAEELRYDIERLTDRFGLGYETVCHRLSTLQRPRLRGVPFSFVRVDRAGNMSKRQSATGFHFSRAGGTCPLWNVYEAFAAPGRIHVQIAAMPDGQRYLWTARAVTRNRGGWGEPGKTFAIGLGCEIRHASRLVYSDGLDLDNASAATPIGMGCRVCERLDCPQRAVPPLGQRLAIDENSTTFVPYPIAPSR
ncbi:short-chain fatty acyl-CoA regulator family protein [Streptomyces sp. NBC_01481]|uniref:short-chain fatty acyl-CoA regulator family protein n=1 Tax=Streptomyces sp. NBC_01481 TaxID=2975869 RepID=UPI0022550539|nr:short-chain fatty acyl-CoA regulator family protein [Streptomyces sp. NBC_01481]MCX4586052.1 short-chain fatty acyl-CoA regulator family protein [Streptomyces sp. NBC_01481]